MMPKRYSPNYHLAGFITQADFKCPIFCKSFLSIYEPFQIAIKLFLENESMDNIAEEHLLRMFYLKFVHHYKLLV
jgi:hypothetical protein